MKVSVIIYIVLFFISSSLLVSCHKTPDSTVSTLLRVAKCMEFNSDSALKLLNSIPHPEKLHGKARADYALLMTQAMDKNFMKFHSDSLILLAVEYYTSNEEDPMMRAKAFFYYGRVMRELDKQEEALKYYFKAREIYDESKEYKMLGLISEEIGVVNRKQKWYKGAIDDFNKALYFYQQAKDSFCIIKAYQNLGRTYLLKSEWDSAKLVLSRALEIASYKSENSEIAILQELGVLYRSKGDLEKAKSFLLASIRKETDQNKLYLKYLSLGYLYYQMKDMENARKFLEMSAKSPKLSTRKDAYNSLYRLEKMQNRYLQAIIYHEKADSINSLIESLNSRAVIADLQKKYENEKLQKNNLEMTMKYTTVILLGILAFSVVTIFMVYYYYKNKNHKKRISEIEHSIKKNEESIREYQIEVDRIQNTKEQLAEENRNKVGELNGKIMILTMQNKTLTEQVKILGGEIKRGESSEQYLPAFRLLLAMKDRNLKEKLSNEDWERLFGLFDWLYNDYRVRMLNSFPTLTKHDLEICCLLKVGFSNENLKCIFNTTSDSVTRAKTRLKSRLGMSASDDLDFYLRNF